MVSIRRRKLLGHCSGRNSFLSPLIRFTEKDKVPDNISHSTRPLTVHLLPLTNADRPKEDNSLKAHPGPSNASGSSSSKEQQIQDYPVKRRKRHRRKQVENQEPCLMRGVYFKNMKWQAAIKVDKKQIHLGTVVSQEEAARLYDRAAFMCGREPNFELCEEEKQELSRFKWDEFLAKTRSAITSKRHRRRLGEGAPVKAKRSMQYSDSEGAREFVRARRKALSPDDFLNSAIAGFGSGAILDRLQAGQLGAICYSVIFAVVGTTVDYATLKLKPTLEIFCVSVKENLEKSGGWLKLPE